MVLKVVHAAAASGQDPRVEVRRRLLNYRNTPHPSTGKSPAELMIRRQIRTRLPIMMKPTVEKIDKEAKVMDIETREKRKRRFDKTKHAKDERIVKGDKVLVKQQKTTIKPPYDPKPYLVTEVVGTQITATRAGKETRRNKAKIKGVKDRPVHLQRLAKEGTHQEYWDSDDDFDIQLESTEQVQEEQIQREQMQEEQVQMQEQGLGISEEVP